MRQYIVPILPTVLPASLIGLAYLTLLGYRHDYLGHYAAGFGGTLAALALALRTVPDEHFFRRVAWRVCLVTLACIAAGAYAELTLFNIAKFDEVDFCNQSLGAVLAGLGMLANSRGRKPSGELFQFEFYAGAIALHVGFFFAIF